MSDKNIWQINLYSKTSIHVQIANIIKFAIVSNILKPGDQLPSISELEEKLSIGNSTIQRTYAILKAAKIIYTRYGVGHFIEEFALEKATTQVIKRITENLRETIREAEGSNIKIDQIIMQIRSEIKEDDPVYI